MVNRYDLKITVNKLWVVRIVLRKIDYHIYYTFITRELVKISKIL